MILCNLFVFKVVYNPDSKKDGTQRKSLIDYYDLEIVFGLYTVEHTTQASKLIIKLRLFFFLL